MNLARRLAALAVRIAPRDRRAWAEALQSELAFVPAQATTSYAAGGVVMALRLRIAHPPLVLGAARYGLALAALAWSALNLRLALQVSDVQPWLPTWLMVAVALVFAVGGIATAAGGLRLTSRLSVLALGLVAAYAGAVAFLLPASPHQAFYSALAVEDAFALLLALLIATSAQRYATARALGPGRGA